MELGNEQCVGPQGLELDQLWNWGWGLVGGDSSVGVKERGRLERRWQGVLGMRLREQKGSKRG